MEREMENREPVKIFRVEFHNNAVACSSTANEIPVEIVTEDILADES